jgi:superfamily II DNA or RNA helicase
VSIVTDDFQTSYQRFLETKSQMGDMSGFEPVFMPSFLFDFQKSLVEWAVRKGRAAIFADCGLGKTPMQLVWAENVRRKTDRPVLILTPLAVAGQTAREAEKFGIEGTSRRSPSPTTNGCTTSTPPISQGWSATKAARLRP